MTKITELSHYSELTALIRFRRKKLGELVLGSSFKHPDKSTLEKDLNRYYYACGCNMSALLLIVGLVAGGLFDTYMVQQTSIASFVLTLVVGGMSGAILGKVIGLYQADIALKKTISSIQDLWQSLDS